MKNKGWNNIVLFGLLISIILVASWFLNSQNWDETLKMFLAVTTAVLIALYQAELKERLIKFKEDISQDYISKYLRYMEYRCRDFEMLGFNVQGEYELDLDAVFVELSLQKINNDWTLEKGLPIWEYLQKRKEQGKEISCQRIVILGAPGSGKSTLLTHIALKIATNTTPIAKFNRIPILLQMRDIEPLANSENHLTFPEIIHKISDDGVRNLNLPSNWFSKLLEQGKCIVMLDGLDEVADLDSRKNIVKWVQNIINSYPQDCFILTSRPHGYRSNPLKNVTVLQIQPFNKVSTEVFIQKWYLANGIMRKGKNDEGVKVKAESKAKDLMRRLNLNSALIALADNPLLITMIATIHSFKGILPGRRVDLYHDIFDVFLRRRQEFWRGKQLEPTQVFEVLKLLAYKMMDVEKREVEEQDAITIIDDELKKTGTTLSSSDFLKSIYHQAGFLLEIESGKYAFAHLTFQEYLASAYIIDDKTENLQKALLEKIGGSWWIETIKLYAAQTDATPIIQKCKSLAPFSPSTLALALVCVKEGLKIDPLVRKEINEFVDQCIESKSVEERKIAAEAKLASRLKEGWMQNVGETTLIDNSLITNIEYQLFLDEMKEKGKFFAPDHWLDIKFPEGEGKLPLSGIRAADGINFCEWLTERDVLYTHSQYYRLPNDIESQKFMPSENGSTYWIIQEKKPHYTLGPEPVFTTITQAQIRAILEKDFETLKDINEAIHYNQNLGKQRPSSQVLLARVFEIFTGGNYGTQNEDRSRIFDEQLTREFEVKTKYKKYQEIAKAMNLELDGVVGVVAILFLDKDNLEQKNQYSNWLSTKTHFIFENLDFGTALQELNLLLKNSGANSLVFSNLLVALGKIITREWLEFQDSETIKRSEVFNFIRWYTRLCITFLGAINKSDNTSIYKDAIVVTSVLELLLTGALPKHGGIRLVKQEK